MPKPGSVNMNNPIGGSNGYIPSTQPKRTGVQPLRVRDYAPTIDDFRQFASGKYNAGAVPVDRAGLHRTWERLEKGQVDPSEASAMRLAFAFALEAAGVSGERMSDACRRLGLEADFSFAQGGDKVFTPLSRKEVREIIDQSFGKSSGRTEPSKVNQPKVEPLKSRKNNIIDLDMSNDDLIKDEPDDIIRKESNNIINEPRMSLGGRKSDVMFEDDDIDMKIDDKNDAEKRKAIAKANMGTLIWAFTDHYGESTGLEMYEISDILKRVDDWEEKLADCEKDTFGIRMEDLNEDLKNFCRENYSVIQKGIDEAIAAKKTGK